MLSYGLDAIVTKLQANLLTKPSVFYYFVNCIFKSCLNINYYYYIIIKIQVSWKHGYIVRKNCFEVDPSTHNILPNNKQCEWE